MKTILFLIFISLNTFAIDPMTSFHTSNVNDKEYLLDIFNKMNKNTKRYSQCYERAHVWSYQIKQKRNLNTQKMFVYFTRKYQREINGQWWFHVAPGIYFNSELYMLDPEFLKRPVKFEAWKNGCIEHAIRKLTPFKINTEKEINALKKEAPNPNTRRGRKRIKYINERIKWLTKNLKEKLINNSRLVDADNNNWPFDDNFKKIIDIDCPMITNYSEYKNAQETHYCFVQASNMYVWEPSELKELEHKDQNKTKFENSEIYTSYKKAFTGRFPFRFLDD